MSRSVLTNIDGLNLISNPFDKLKKKKKKWWWWLYWWWRVINRIIIKLIHVDLSFSISLIFSNIHKLSILLTKYQFLNLLPPSNQKKLISTQSTFHLMMLQLEYIYLKLEWSMFIDILIFLTPHPLIFLQYPLDLIYLFLTKI